jgi:hypothetical protein
MKPRTVANGKKFCDILDDGADSRRPGDVVAVPETLVSGLPRRNHLLADALVESEVEGPNPSGAIAHFLPVLDPAWVIFEIRPDSSLVREPRGEISGSVTRATDCGAGGQISVGVVRVRLNGTVSLGYGCNGMGRALFTAIAIRVISYIRFVLDIPGKAVAEGLGDAAVNDG